MENRPLEYLYKIKQSDNIQSTVHNLSEDELKLLTKMVKNKIIYNEILNYAEWFRSESIAGENSSFKKLYPDKDFIIKRDRNETFDVGRFNRSYFYNFDEASENIKYLYELGDLKGMTRFALKSNINLVSDPLVTFSDIKCTQKDNISTKFEISVKTEK